MPESNPYSILKESNGTQNIAFTLGTMPKNYGTDPGCVAVPCTFSLQKSHGIISNSICNTGCKAHAAGWGVPGRAGGACVPIASAKVRRKTAVRKETQQKTAKIPRNTPNFGLHALQNTPIRPFLPHFPPYPTPYPSHSTAFPRRPCTGLHPFRAKPGPSHAVPGAYHGFPRHPGGFTHHRAGFPYRTRRHISRCPAKTCRKAPRNHVKAPQTRRAVPWNRRKAP